jgi:glycosyltransferase involved in cell wall biosynthesis
MKILIVLPNFCGGGAERLHIYLANSWVEFGHSVEFLLMQNKGELQNLLHKKIKINTLSVSKIRNSIFPMYKFIKNANADIVLSAMWPLTTATIIAWLMTHKKGRLFVSDHVMLDISAEEELNISRAWLSFLVRNTYHFADGIVAVSNGVKDNLCFLGNIPSSAIQVIYNPAFIGCQTDRESVNVVDKLWGRKYKYHILSVGTLKAQKDHATLIRAFSILSSKISAKLIILGDGPLKNNLESLIYKLGLEDCVSLPGFFIDPYPWFRSADLFVLSSQWEGFGNVLVESLECGVPVVSTNCPSGPSEILKDGRYGKLVPIGDLEAMAIAMEDSLTQDCNRSTLMKRAENFSVPYISRQYLEYFLTGRVL